MLAPMERSDHHRQPLHALSENFTCRIVQLATVFLRSDGGGGKMQKYLILQIPRNRFRLGSCHSHCMKEQHGRISSCRHMFETAFLSPHIFIKSIIIAASAAEMTAMPTAPLRIPMAQTRMSRTPSPMPSRLPGIIIYFLIPTPHQASS